MTATTGTRKRHAGLVGFAGWAGAGILFMVGCIAPVGFLLWLPALSLAGAMIGAGARSPRFFFAFVAGIGLALVALGLVNRTYLTMLLLGGVTFAGGVVFFSAFGPRTSHADPP